MSNKNILLFSVCFMLMFANLCAASSSSTEKSQELFKADLSNAICPKGVWTFKDGVLTASKDSFIWTEKEYDDFVFDFEFKTENGTNSGVALRNTDMKNWVGGLIEVQLAGDYHHWKKVPPTWRCGAIFGYLAPTKKAVKKPGQWNRMQITCKGKNITVVLNDEKVIEMDMSLWTSNTKNPDGSGIPFAPKTTSLAEAPLKGRIGLQGQHGGVPTCFRNLRIKELDPEPAQSKKSHELFKADLSNAIYPAGVWTFKDGVLTASKDKFIWTEKEYDDFVLDLEFKTDVGTNSGVVLRNTNMKNWISGLIEVQIADDFAQKWKKAHPTWHCGAIFGHLAPTKSCVKKPGQWNRMQITCKGKMITVVLNDEKIIDMDLALWTSGTKNPDGSDIPRFLPNAALAVLPLKGRIGLQGKHAGAPIYFRNLQIRQL